MKPEVSPPDLNTEASPVHGSPCPSANLDASGSGADELLPDEDEQGAAPSAEAARRAAVILEVLGGVRGPGEAAELLGISAAHYYLLERKALAGLVRACVVQPKGRAVRQQTLEEKVHRLERDLEESRREVLRQAALVRATQRALGVPETSSVDLAQVPSSGRSGKSAGRKKTDASQGGRSRPRRRPAVRALRAAASLRAGPAKAQAKSGQGAGDRLQSAESGPVSDATDRSASG